MTAIEAALRETLAETYCSIERLGLSICRSGNVSVRFEDRMLITPAGADGSTIKPEAVVEATFDGRVREGGRPSSEWSMHAEIYRAFPEAGAVVHAHADACVALSCCRRDIPAFHYMIASFGGNDIRCADYALFGTPELARAAVRALAGRKACLLANHGMICHGRTPQDALAGALKLEMLARQYCLSLTLGEPVLLSREEMAAAHRRYAGGYSADAREHQQETNSAP